jgi:hypothetical protein
MLRNKLIRVFAALLVLSVVAPAEEAREWTSTDGRTLKGKLVGLYAEGAKIEVNPRKIVEIPFDRLVPADAEYARKAGAAILPKWGGWPDELRMNLDDVKIKVDEARSKDGLTYYITEHFELRSEVELGSRVMLDVGRIFELTYRLMEASPWGVMASPEGGHFKAELYKTRAGYVAAGAPEWSGGVYIGSRKVFMVPVESLGLKEGTNGYRRDDTFSLETVVHEITHMLMADAIPCLPIAVTEGVAEYMSKIPLRTGSFRPGSVLQLVREEAEVRQPLDFSVLLNMTASEWSGTAPPKGRPGGSTMPVNPKDKSFQYHGSLLLAYHLMHGLDGGKPERVRRLIHNAHARAVGREKLVAKYKEDFATYEAEIKKFTARPDVTATKDGGFSYPSDLTPPQAPTFPIEGETERSLELSDMDVLFGGKSVAEFVAEMNASLKDAKIDLKGARR